jgi:AraC-like DNA-binding protein
VVGLLRDVKPALELWAIDQTKKNKMNAPETTTIPTAQEIAAQEKRLAEMKKTFEQAKKKNAVDLHQMIDIIPESLNVADQIRLLTLLNQKLKSDHRSVRGSPVSPELRNNLEAALKMNGHSLPQLQELFGLSVSYIARVKKEMGLTRRKEKKAKIEAQAEAAA